MPEGPGKYDEEATAALLATRAKGIILVVIGGHSGQGFEVQLTQELMDSKTVSRVVEAIRSVADEIEKHGLNGPRH